LCKSDGSEKEAQGNATDPTEANEGVVRDKGEAEGVGEEGATKTGDGMDDADGNDNSKATNSSSLAKSGAHFLNL